MLDTDLTYWKRTEIDLMSEKCTWNTDPCSKNYENETGCIHRYFFHNIQFMGFKICCDWVYSFARDRNNWKQMTPKERWRWRFSTIEPSTVTLTLRYIAFIMNSPMREHNWIRIGMQDRHHRLRLDEGLDLFQDDLPLKLVLRVVGGPIVVDLAVQLGDQLPHELHFLEQQADDDEAGVVPELLHHQVGAVLLGGSGIIRPASDRWIERVRFVQVVGFAGAEAATNTDCTHFWRVFVRKNISRMESVSSHFYRIRIFRIVFGSYDRVFEYCVTCWGRNAFFGIPYAECCCWKRIMCEENPSKQICLYGILRNLCMSPFVWDVSFWRKFSNRF